MTLCSPACNFAATAGISAAIFLGTVNTPWRSPCSRSLGCTSKPPNRDRQSKVEDMGIGVRDRHISRKQIATPNPLPAAAPAPRHSSHTPRTPALSGSPHACPREMLPTLAACPGPPRPRFAALALGECCSTNLYDRHKIRPAMGGSPLRRRAVAAYPTMGGKSSNMQRMRASAKPAFRSLT